MSLTLLSRTILFAPFVPFIVLFCQVIETKDRTDLSRLQAFVVSIQSRNGGNGSVSEAVDRLCRLFQVLYSVASHYVESHTSGSSYTGGSGGGEDQIFQGSGIGGIGTMTGIDSYLAALGFPPPILASNVNAATAGMEDQNSGSGPLPYHHHGEGQEQYAMKAGDDVGFDQTVQGVDGQEPQRAVDPMIWMGNEAQLEGWLYSNQQMLSFLEDGVLDSLGGLVGGGGTQ